MGKITQKELKERINYNPDTGEFTWLRGQNKGKRAGSVRQHKYRAINFGSLGFEYEHRLAFLYMNGKFPVGVDHINHDKSDNRWENLRDVPHKENTRNQPLRATNTSGYTGVCKNSKKGKKWRAYIVVDGKQKTLGTYNRIRRAAEAVESAKKRYGFHSNHGLAA